jgi:prephenate dehydratase
MKRNKLVGIVPNNEPKNTQNFRKTYSRVAYNNTSEAKHTTNTENVLTQIMQMLKDQNLNLNKIESSVKMTDNH